MRRLLQRFRHDGRGVTALIIAGSMFMIAGFTAIAIDASALFVERRADQTAADVGAVAGAVELLVGVSGGNVSDTAMVAAALDYVRLNLPTTYGPAEWQALWESCVDPAADRNAPDARNPAGYNFVSMAAYAPAGWTIADSANWCISRDGQFGLFRVRTPPQIVEATFARIIGFNSLQTRAAAVVEIVPAGGNILPFGVPVGVAEGSQTCLGSPPPGLADDPCTGQTTGNFGLLKVERYTTPGGCTPGDPEVALNVAQGIDHNVVPRDDPSLNPLHGTPEPDDVDGGDVPDDCKDNPAPGVYPDPANTLKTDTGGSQVSQGAADGLVGGSKLPTGLPLLMQGPQPMQRVVGYEIDDRPLWYWLLADRDDNGPVDYGGLGTSDPNDDAPLFCNPAGFVDGDYDLEEDGNLVDDFDFLGNGNLADLDSWQHMQKCLTDYISGGYSTAIFSPSLGVRTLDDWSPRFGYVPQVWESDLSNQWVHVKRYRAVFILATIWKKNNNNWKTHFPGEDEGMTSPLCFDKSGNSTNCNGAGYSLLGVTGFIIPDNALPGVLKGDPPGATVGSINPFIVRLYR